jgi:pSer/pThr/pTyr-binding forkhead associated (FHA) protein
MRLAYQKEDGQHAFVDLTEGPVVVGRSPEADVVVADSKVSRLHCGVRLVEGEYRVKDLGSRNGTYVNTVKIEAPTVLKPGDHIRIGTTLLSVQERLAKGNETILHEIEEAMGHGKGYRTILREIVEPENQKKD